MSAHRARASDRRRAPWPRAVSTVQVEEVVATYAVVAAILYLIVYAVFFAGESGGGGRTSLIARTARAGLSGSKIPKMSNEATSMKR
jgi:hypothetical protein